MYKSNRKASLILKIVVTACRYLLADISLVCSIAIVCLASIARSICYLVACLKLTVTRVTILCTVTLHNWAA